MNAYAEGALPDGSRSRYFAHLADCDECRGLVTKLTLAASVAETSSATPATAVVKASTSRSWREWLATLFAPPILRYAVPAIALMAVMLVAFVALRGRRDGDNLVAQNERPQANTTAAPEVQFDKQSPAATTATSNTTAPAAPLGGNSANANINAKATNSREADAPAESTVMREKAGESNVAAPKSAPEPIAQQPVDSGVLFGRQQSRDDDKNVQTEMPAPPPPSPSSSVVDLATARKAPAGNDESAYRIESAQKPAGAATKAKASAPASTATNNNYVLDGAENKTQSGSRSTTESRRSRGNPGNGDSVGGATAGPAAKDERSKKEDSEETLTRSVGGRQFRQRGGAWVDTAYNSSRATVNVRRGSEQYRALIADEPGIGNIADQLGGTVIIVWKSRAYKIQ